MKWAIAIAVIKLPVAMALLQSLGLIGLPLSHAVTVTIEVTAMLWILQRRFGILDTSVIKESLKIVAATALMGLILWPLRPYANGLMLFAAVGVGALVSAHLGCSFESIPSLS